MKRNEAAGISAARLFPAGGRSSPRKGCMKMRTRFLWLLVLVLACASGAAEAASEPEAWYSLSENGKAVTVRLPANATTGYAWSYAVSEPARLKAVSAEYIPDENHAQRLGAGGTYMTVFEGVPGASGSVSVQFTYARPFETDGSRIVRTLYLHAGEDGRLQAAPWYELDDEGKVLTVRLCSAQGGRWLFTCSNDRLTLLTAETIENAGSGQWVARFAGLPAQAGEVSLRLVHIPAGETDPDDTRELTLTVYADAALSVLCD